MLQDLIKGNSMSSYKMGLWECLNGKYSMPTHGPKKSHVAMILKLPERILWFISMKK